MITKQKKFQQNLCLTSLFTRDDNRLYIYSNIMLDVFSSMKDFAVKNHINDDTLLSAMQYLNI